MRLPVKVLGNHVCVTLVVVAAVVGDGGGLQLLASLTNLAESSNQPCLQL